MSSIFVVAFKSRCSEEDVVAEDQILLSAQILVRLSAECGDGKLCRVSGAVQQQPVSAWAAVSSWIPPGLCGSLAAAASHLPSLQTQHSGCSLPRQLTVRSALLHCVLMTSQYFYLSVQHVDFRSLSLGLISAASRYCNLFKVLVNLCDFSSLF